MRLWTVGTLWRCRALAGVLVLALGGELGMAQQATNAALVPFEVIKDGIAAPLGGTRGDAARGKTVAFDPERGNCTICHPVPGGDERTQGNVAPTLAGVARRLGEAQIRLRLVDGTRINPETIMPSFYRVEGLQRVGEAYRNKPVLQASEIEDIIAFLMTLKE